jgi:hypothetical protein
LLKNKPTTIHLYIWGIMFSIILVIVEETLMPRVGIHKGLLFPRSAYLSPIKIIWVHYFEWIIQAVCILGIVTKRFVRSNLILLTIIFVFSTLQFFSNHKLLILINLIALCLSKNIFQDEKDQQQKRVFNFIRLQLVVVYFSSIIQKLSHGFLDGKTLKNVMLYVSQSHLEPIVSKAVHLSLINNLFLLKALSISTLVIEFLIPFLLVRKFKIGLTIQIVFHCSLSLMLPGIWSFTIPMISMGLLYNIPREVNLG